ncbi:hypothetical protein PR003_g23054 [Phytophthora rubi]|uniref:Uncharacterized protein n=1 Tax=Phytophthora rubi TaxID=129364 RepID=A0A6A4DAJ3_9STRA|nr:hypothetical protein PR003_g23054 [Phytophthora rubi]
MVQSWIFPYFLAVSILPDLSTIQGLLLHLYVGQNCPPSVVIVSICGGSSVGSSRIHSSFLNQLRASSSYPPSSFGTAGSARLICPPLAVPIPRSIVATHYPGFCYKLPSGCVGLCEERSLVPNSASRLETSMLATPESTCPCVGSTIALHV